MNSKDLRKRFLDFFESNKHVIVPSSSLLPDDPSVLLTTAGMQQFKPYYTGKADPMKSPHPELGGKPLGSKSATSVQKCFRTSDIDEVGDETHLTFFEMLGNFSFGDYFKEEAIKLAYDFLTKELDLAVEYVTIFAGDEKTAKDEVSAEIWRKIGFSESRGNLRLSSREDNFWGPTGNEGPCGPTTEIYMNGTEIWNIVFNEYYCKADGDLVPLDVPGVDTGMGLERLAMISQNKANIFETDLFMPIIDALPINLDLRVKRIIADHMRGSALLLSDGILPSNKEAGYILRRLMRRVMVYAHMHNNFSPVKTIDNVIDIYAGVAKYDLDRTYIQEEFSREYDKFKKSVARGLKELSELSTIDAISAFKLYESYGLPYEIIKELGHNKANSLTRNGFDVEFKKHQEASRAGREQKFGGHGLILDTGELKASNEEEVKIVTRLHTATHLLQAALRKVLGSEVHQAGSDITAERLRFDFTLNRKPNEQEIKDVENLVNEAILRNFDMGFVEMPYEEAIKTGALYFTKEKYPANVKVYSAVDPKNSEVFSSELCGGPHVTHTAEVGHFRIIKEESVGAGMRRIRAIVE